MSSAGLAQTRQTIPALDAGMVPDWTLGVCYHDDEKHEALFWETPGFKGGDNRGMRRERADRRARAICAPCPIRAECLEFALAINAAYGIWGGLTTRERRKIRRRRERVD